MYSAAQVARNGHEGWFKGGLKDGNGGWLWMDMKNGYGGWFKRWL
jgi:hypothetical protein